MAELTTETFGQVVQILAKTVKLVGAKGLTDDELSLVLSVDQKHLEGLLQDMWFFSRSWCEAEVRRRKRHVDLSVLPTEEIQRRLSEYHEDRQAAITADVNDEAGDSLYEAPPVDSDESILSDLLQERRAAETTPTVRSDAERESLWREQRRIFRT